MDVTFQKENLKPTEYFKTFGQKPRMKFRTRMLHYTPEDGDAFEYDGNTWVLSNVVRVDKNIYEGELL
jgi:hypothetical protein